MFLSPFLGCPILVTLIYLDIFYQVRPRVIPHLKYCLVLFFNTVLRKFLLGNRYSQGTRIFSRLHIAGAKKIVTVLVGWEVALISETLTSFN